MYTRCGVILILVFLCSLIENQAENLDTSEDDNPMSPVIYGCDDKFFKDFLPSLDFVKLTNENLNLKLEIIKTKLEILEKIDYIQQFKNIEEKLKEISSKINDKNDFSKSLTDVENNFNNRVKALEDKTTESSIESLKQIEEKLNTTAVTIIADTNLKMEDLKNVLKQQTDDDLEKIKNNLIIQFKEQQRLEGNESLVELNNCAEALKNNQSVNGIYMFHVLGVNPLKAYCIRHRVIEEKPAWTVIQRRRNGKVDFYRNWSDYKEGFGELENDFWLGLDRLHAMTSKDDYELSIDMEDWEGEKRFAKYDYFMVDNESNGYLLKLGQYDGNAGNSLKSHNNTKFTTKDMDNDNSTRNCALVFFGGWWYENCHDSNLNGLYNNTEGGEGINWRGWHGYNYSLKYVEMAIRLKAIK